MFTYIHPVNVNRRPRRPLYAKRLPLRDGFYYYSLDFPCVNGAYDWNGLCVDGRVLLPMNITAPESLKTFGTDIWRCILLVRLLTRTMDKERCDLAVTDLDGRLLPCVKRLYPFAKGVYIFTKAPHIYDELRQRVLKESGQYIAVNTAAGIHNGYSFSPFSPPAAETDGLRQIGLSDLRESAIHLPKEWLEVMPPDASKIAFGEVLYTTLKIGKISDYLNSGALLV